jgi:AraC-like DNA-binding protein
MDEPWRELGLLHFSTDALPPRDRFETWRDVLTRKLLHVAIDRLSDRPFRAKASLRILPGLRVGSGVIGASLHQRTHAIAAADNDDVALMVNLGGPFVIQRGDVEMQLGLGDACLVDCSETGAFVRTAPGRLLCVRLPRASLGGLTRRLDDALGRLIPSDTDVLRLLVPYVSTLCEGDVLMLSPAAARIVVDHVADLIALIVGADPDATGGGLRAARLGAVKAYIGERLGELDLSIEAVAAREKVSSRYVRKLFEGEGVSFSAYVAGERLARAHAMLASPRFHETPVSAIAFDVGFGDLSYFNRLFRRRYQATPSDVRAEAQDAWRTTGKPDASGA